MRNLLILIFLFLLSCKASQTSTTEAAGQNGAPGALNNHWLLAEVNGQSVHQLSYSEQPTLDFNTTEKRLNGHDGCNNFFGQLEISDDQHNKITILGSTKAFCPEIKNSDMLGQYLNAVTTYKIKEDNLFLLDEKGSEFLRYRKAE